MMDTLLESKFDVAYFLFHPGRFKRLGQDMDAARHALQEGYKVCEEYGQCWIAAGTALGLARDGELIEHDTDIDIEMWSHNFKGSMLNRFTEDLKWIHHLIQIDDRGTVSQLVYVTQEGIIFDIYFYKDNRWDEATNRSRSGELWIPKKMLDNLDETIYNGKAYKMPGPRDEYLAHRFGPNWGTPTEDKVPWEEECLCLR